MDKEVLRLFGLTDDSAPVDFAGQIAEEYVPDKYLNGHRVLKRWSFCVRSRRLKTMIDMRVTVMDQLTHRVRIWEHPVKQLWCDCTDKSLHCDTLSGEIPGDWFDLVAETESERGLERELHLLNSLGGMGDYIFRLNSDMERKEIEDEERRRGEA